MAWTHEQMCTRAARELKDGYYVNLGIGIPTQVANYIPKGVNFTLQSENGMLGMGPFPTKETADADLINAGKQTITELPNSCYFDSATSFAMIRGGHVDLAILGALQVSQDGDIANWMVPGKMVKGKKVVVLMEHNAKDGGAKLVKECNLPLTGKRVVNMVISDLGVFTIESGKVQLIELADGVTLDEVRQRTEAPFTSLVN